MSEADKIKKPGLHPEMNSGKTITERENAHMGSGDYGAEERRSKMDAEKNVSINEENKRAKMNDKKGKFKTEPTKETGEPSAIPGAEEEGDLGDAASGAGLGGNEGQGTGSRNKQ